MIVRLSFWCLLATGIVMLSPMHMAPTPKSPYPRKDATTATTLSIETTITSTTPCPSTQASNLSSTTDYIYLTTIVSLSNYSEDNSTAELTVSTVITTLPIDFEPPTTQNPFTTTDSSSYDHSSSTDSSDLARDIAELFVASQDSSIADALAIDEDATLGFMTGDTESAAVVEEMGGEPFPNSTRPVDNEVETAQPTEQSTTDSPTTTITEDVDKLDDAFFDVIIDDRPSTATANQTEPVENVSQLLEVDSEEFFVPADIKERETTALPALTTTTTTASHSFRPDTAAPDDNDDPPTRRDQQQPSTVNQDTADTIFYISNTEVKVGETQPTPNTNKELQFFPATYQEDVIIDVHRKNSSSWGAVPDKYEEDLIMSKHNQQPPEMAAATIYDESANSAASDDNLSISYIGESFIEVKEFSRDTLATDAPPAAPAAAAADSYVIIQPIAIDMVSRTTPEIPIGVPVIEELPPALIRQFETSEEENEIIAPLSSSFEQQDATVVSNEKILKAKPKNEQSSSLMEYTLYGKSLPAKRNSAGGTATNASAAAGNGTALKAFGMNKDQSIFSSVTDTTTVLLACVATITPLILCTLLAYGLRYYWKKKRIDRDPTNEQADNVLALSGRNEPQFKQIDAGQLLNGHNRPRTDGDGAAPPLPPPNVRPALPSSSVHTETATAQQPSSYQRPNGSLITMTMKNNQLIVETEERHDMPPNTRETKVHYTTGDKDGVFIVEVARGADSSYIHKDFSDHLPPAGPTCNGSAGQHAREDISLLPNEAIQVHQPPPDTIAASKSEENAARDIETIPEESIVPLAKSQTGLSQSNLSLASSCDSNRDYRYGDLTHYTVNPNGYQSGGSIVYTTPAVPAPVVCEPVPSKPIIRSAIYKQESLDATAKVMEEASALAAANKVDDVKRSPAMPIKEENEVQTAIPVSVKKVPAPVEEPSAQPPLANVTVDAPAEPTPSDAPGAPVPELIDDVPFDSLINLPEPPSLDEIQLLNEITCSENNNMDSLPPPPPIDPDAIEVTGAESGDRVA